jgi:hypothetical protein
MTEAEGRLILGKWIEETTPLQLFLVVPPLGLSLFLNGATPDWRTAVLSRDLTLMTLLAASRSSVRATNMPTLGTRSITKTGKPLHLVDAIAALKNRMCRRFDCHPHRTEISHDRAPRSARRAVPSAAWASNSNGALRGFADIARHHPLGFLPALVSINAGSASCEPARSAL